MFEREPLPEVLRGDPERMRHLIDACPHQWSYRAGVISFTGEDMPTTEQQAIVMDGFEGLAFAGLESDQHAILWVRHTHEDRVELHFVTPRMELTEGRSLNIAPPGYQNSFDALRDVLNKEHCWNDPQAPERAREVKSLIENIERGQGREVIHDWILDRVEEGSVTNRSEMIEAFTENGFDIVRAGKNYITVRAPENDNRWRLKGDIFHENWTRENTLERSSRREPAQTSRSGSRLDAIDINVLRARLDRIVERRRSYNGERYPGSHSEEREIEKPHVFELEYRSVGIAFDDSAQPDSQLVLGEQDDRPRPAREPLASGLDDSSNENWASAHLGQGTASTVRLSYWQRIQQMFANFGKEIENGSIGNTQRHISDTARARIAEIRRKIDRSFRTIGRAVQNIGKEMERQEEQEANGLGGDNRFIDGLSSQIRRSLVDSRDRFRRENGRSSRRILRQHGADRAIAQSIRPGSDVQDDALETEPTRSVDSDYGY